MRRRRAAVPRRRPGRRRAARTSASSGGSSASTSTCSSHIAEDYIPVDRVGRRRPRGQLATTSTPTRRPAPSRARWAPTRSSSSPTSPAGCATPHDPASVISEAARRRGRGRARRRRAAGCARSSRRAWTRSTAASRFAHIVDGRVPHSLLLELFTDAGIGTKIRPALASSDARARSIANYARYPVEFVRGEGARLWDAEGNEYLDFLAGIAVCNTGHCHPRVVAAVQRAGGAADARLQPLLHRADDAAGRAAGRALAGRQGVLLQLGRRGQRGGAQARAQAPAAAATSWCVHGGFHGRTYGALSATPQEAKQAPFAPLVPGLRRRRADGRRRSRRRSTSDTAAVLLEPIQGESGRAPARPTTCCAPRARPATRTARC